MDTLTNSYFLNIFQIPTTTKTFGDIIDNILSNENVSVWITHQYIFTNSYTYNKDDIEGEEQGKDQEKEQTRCYQ